MVGTNPTRASAGSWLRQFRTSPTVCKTGSPGAALGLLEGKPCGSAKSGGCGESGWGVVPVRRRTPWACCVAAQRAWRRLHRRLLTGVAMPMVTPRVAIAPLIWRISNSRPVSRERSMLDRFFAVTSAIRRISFRRSSGRRTTPSPRATCTSSLMTPSTTPSIPSLSRSLPFCTPSRAVKGFSTAFTANFFHRSWSRVPGVLSTRTGKPHFTRSSFTRLVSSNCMRWGRRVVSPARPVWCTSPGLVSRAPWFVTPTTTRSGDTDSAITFSLSRPFWRVTTMPSSARSTLAARARFAVLGPDVSMKIVRNFPPAWSRTSSTDVAACTGRVTASCPLCPPSRMVSPAR
mmetsp:Transcript_14714/g.41848  ORF Transcript_14714/g.41848 Transcript_14714/m.41848 type:complete len:346 (-) Transcript_14714:1637-2674(-)